MKQGKWLWKRRERQESRQWEKEKEAPKEKGEAVEGQAETAQVWAAAAGEQKEVAEEEVQGSWEPELFLRVNDPHKPWSHTQRAVCRSGG